MKNYLILFGLLFSIFIIPSDVLAAGEDLYIPYYNLVEEFDIKNNDGENIKNILYNDSNVSKEDGDKCILFYQPNSSYRYRLSCISRPILSINFSYDSNNNSFAYIFSDIFKNYSFDENKSFISEKAYVISTSKNSFENYILYSDIPISFYASGVNNIYFYDINDSSKIYGQFNTVDNYSYKDLYLTEFSDDIVVFQDNDFHSISKLILTDNIPEEFSFVYTISDYLLCLILVGIIISPVAIIIKVMRW